MTGGEIAAGNPQILSSGELDLLQVLGIAGFVLYALAYLLIAIGRLTGDSIAYYALNLGAASLVMLSLVSSFNLPSALIQSFWIAISAVGICIAVFRTAPVVEITLSTPHRSVANLRPKDSIQDLVIIDEFQSELDSICIEVDVGPDDHLHREIDLRKSQNGNGIDLWLDGNLVAHVSNVLDVSQNHVRLVPKGEDSKQAKVHWISG